MGKNTDNKNKNRKIKLIYNASLVICILVFCSCGVYLFRYFSENKKSEDKFDILKSYIDADDIATSSDVPLAVVVVENNEKTEEYVELGGKLILKKYAKLYSLNEDFVGWIKISGTNIDYPVMQSLYEEEYYINRDFEKKYSSAGSLFVDTSSDIEKPSDLILIYGHNMKVMTMFHDITKYKDESFYNNHKIIQFDTIYGSGEYEVIAAFPDKIYSSDYTGIKYYDFFDAKTIEEYEEYVNYCKSKTPYEISTTAAYPDKLILLSTCDNKSEDGRFAVLAKRVK